MTRNRPAAALAVGLVLVAGCSIGGQPAPGTPEGPKPSRALVTWSDTVCSNVKLLDELLSTEKSSLYTGQIQSTVDSALGDLDAIERSGIKRADTYVTELTRQLRRFRERSPEDSASQLTELTDRIGKQQPKLAKLAGRARELAPSYHLAPSCSPLKPPPELSTPATPKLVSWADTMCEGLASIGDLPTPGDKLLKDPRFAPFEDSELSSYITSVPSYVTSIREPLAKLSAIGIADADTYRSKLVTALRNAEKKLPQDVSTLDLYDLPIKRLRARAQQVAGTVAAITPQGPDLSTIARKHPALSAAHDLAPRCEPAGATRSTSTADPLPKARDGKNVAACKDGRCQIEVSAPVDVAVRRNVLTAAVSEGTVWLASDGTSLIRLGGPGGEARFGLGSMTVVFSIAAATDTAAVLDVSTTGGR